jgi:hypothetical protein
VCAFIIRHEDLDEILIRVAEVDKRNIEASRDLVYGWLGGLYRILRKLGVAVAAGREDGA